MNVYLISDTHFNHQNIATYCQRPTDFTEVIIKRWNETVQSGDTVIHLGDVMIGKKSEWIMPSLPGRKILIRGNHDRSWSNTKWMKMGFDFSCDAMMFRDWWITHEPAQKLPWSEGESCQGNIHGHLHNIWDGFRNPDDKRSDCFHQRKLSNPWQRLFAIEYTDYRPVEFNKFVSHPDKYQSRGPKSQGGQ